MKTIKSRLSCSWLQWIFVLVAISLTSCSSLNPLEWIFGRNIHWDWRKEKPVFYLIADDLMSQHGQELLTIVPRDIDNYCPNYRELSPENRQLFWVMLLSCIARHESSHNPACAYQEQIKNKYGDKVISRGLLQISYLSSRRYLPSIQQSDDLHVVHTNLLCGIEILKTWVLSDGVISLKKNGKWYGGARYWSVLRANAKHEEIKGWLRSVDYPDEPLAKPSLSL